MTRFNFEPDGGRKGRNRYVGSWTETSCRVVPVPFNRSGLITVLKWGAEASAPYTHQEIANWCGQFRFQNDSRSDSNASASAIDIADDVNVQWDLYLANTYALAELQKLDFSKIELPREWFVAWLRRLD